MRTLIKKEYLGEVYTYVQSEEFNTAFKCELNITDKLLYMIEDNPIIYNTITTMVSKNNLMVGNKLVIFNYLISNRYLNLNILIENEQGRIIDYGNRMEYKLGIMFQKFLVKNSVKFNKEIIITTCIEDIQNDKYKIYLRDYFSPTISDNIYDIFVEGKYIKPSQTLKISNINKIIKNTPNLRCVEYDFLNIMEIDTLYIELSDNYGIMNTVGTFKIMKEDGTFCKRWEYDYVEEKLEQGKKLNKEIVSENKEKYFNFIKGQIEDAELKFIERFRTNKDVYRRRKNEIQQNVKEELEYLNQDYDSLLHFSFFELLCEQGEVIYLD